MAEAVGKENIYIETVLPVKFSENTVETSDFKSVEYTLNYDSDIMHPTNKIFLLKSLLCHFLETGCELRLGCPPGGFWP